MLLAECFQLLSQSGIVGLDVGGVLALIEKDDGFFFVFRTPLKTSLSNKKAAQK